MGDRPAPIFVPVSAQDFARRKRKIVWSCIGAAALIVLLGAWIYKRSTDPIHAQDSYANGERMLRSLRYTQSILAFNEAIALKSDFTDAYLLRARAHVFQGDLEPAAADFTKVIRLRPADAVAYVERAQVYLSQMNYQAAMADGTDALARNSQLAPAYNIRGTVYRIIGEPSKALAEFNRAVELSADADNLFQRAATYQLLNEHKLAIADLDRVISFKPDSPEGYYARARSERAIGDEESAARDFRQGRALDSR